MKLDVKSIESSVPPTNGRGPKEGASKGSVKKRLGHRVNDSPDKSPVSFICYFENISTLECNIGNLVQDFIY